MRGKDAGVSVNLKLPKQIFYIVLEAISNGVIKQDKCILTKGTFDILILHYPQNIFES